MLKAWGNANQAGEFREKQTIADKVL